MGFEFGDIGDIIEDASKKSGTFAQGDALTAIAMMMFNLNEKKLKEVV
jgi:hypothetical protein